MFYNWNKVYKPAVISKNEYSWLIELKSSPEKLFVDTDLRKLRDNLKRLETAYHLEYCMTAYANNPIRPGHYNYYYHKDAPTAAWNGNTEFNLDDNGYVRGTFERVEIEITDLPDFFEFCMMLDITESQVVKVLYIPKC